MSCMRIAQIGLTPTSAMLAERTPEPQPSVEHGKSYDSGDRRIVSALGQKALILTNLRCTQLLDAEWIKTLKDGRKVKFVYQALPKGGAFITAQLEGHEVVYSVLLTNARAPVDRQDVESHFENELSQKH